MRIVPKKFQMGGAMEAPEEAPVDDAAMESAPEQPAPEEGQNPLIMLADGAMQALLSGDCQMAMQVCQGLVLILQQMAGPQQEQPQGEPVFAKRGAKLIRRI